MSPGVTTLFPRGLSSGARGRVVRPSNRPGLGVELNKAEIKKHPFEPEIVDRVFYPDGAIGDW